MSSPSRIESVHAILSGISDAQIRLAIGVEDLRREIGEVLCGDTDPLADRPRTDARSYTVVWKGRKCELGNTTSFRLAARLLLQPNRFVSHDELLRDVWLGDRRAQDTVRSAVRYLRLKLMESRMPALAACIRGTGRSYGVFLGGEESIRTPLARKSAVGSHGRRR